MRGTSTPPRSASPTSQRGGRRRCGGSSSCPPRLSCRSRSSRCSRRTSCSPTFFSLTSSALSVRSGLWKRPYSPSVGHRKPIFPSSYPLLEASRTGSPPRHDHMTKRNGKGPRGPKIVTVPPGPKSKAALARKEKFITNGVRVALPIDVTWAQGPFVRDADGNVYVDLGGGIGVQTVGPR